MLGHGIGIDLSINGAHDCTILDSTGRLAQRFTFDSSSAGLLKLEQRIRALDPSHSAHTVVMEPTGLAWRVGGTSAIKASPCGHLAVSVASAYATLQTAEPVQGADGALLTPKFADVRFRGVIRNRA